MTTVRNVTLSLALALMAGLAPNAAHSGAFTIDPGRQTWIDTDQQGFTTITARNLGQELGRLTFPDSQFPPLEIRPGEQIELNGRVRRPSIQVRNEGLTKIQVITRYMERPLVTP